MRRGTESVNDRENPELQFVRLMVNRVRIVLILENGSERNTINNRIRARRSSARFPIFFFQYNFYRDPSYTRINRIRYQLLLYDIVRKSV